MAQNRRQEDIGAYQRALAINPRWELYLNLAGLLVGVGRTQEAAEAYNHSIQLNPGDSRIYSPLGDLLFAQRKYEEAISAYEKSLALNPNNPRDRLNLAKAYRIAKRYDDALSSYENALSLSPRDRSRAYRGMASVYAAKNDRERASQFAQKALTTNP